MQKKRSVILSSVLIGAMLLSGCGAVNTVQAAAPDAASLAGESTAESSSESVAQDVPVTEVSREVPDECELTAAQMKESINNYVNSSSGKCSVTFNDDGTVDFTMTVKGTEDEKGRFVSVNECFGYLFNRHQVDVLGNVTDFAKGVNTGKESTIISTPSSSAASEAAASSDSGVTTETDSRIMASNVG